jgi:hypothetical protein
VIIIIMAQEHQPRPSSSIFDESSADDLWIVPNTIVAKPTVLVTGIDFGVVAGRGGDLNRYEYGCGLLTGCS